MTVWTIFQSGAVLQDTVTLYHVFEDIARDLRTVQLVGNALLGKKATFSAGGQVFKDHFINRSVQNHSDSSCRQILQRLHRKRLTVRQELDCSVGHADECLRGGGEP